MLPSIAFAQSVPVSTQVKVALTLQQALRGSGNILWKLRCLHSSVHTGLSCFKSAGNTCPHQLSILVCKCIHTHTDTHTGFYVYLFYWWCVLRSLPGDCRPWASFHIYLGGSSLEVLCLLNANSLVLAPFIVIRSLLQGLNMCFLNQWRAWVSIFPEFPYDWFSVMSVSVKQQGRLCLTGFEDGQQVLSGRISQILHMHCQSWRGMGTHRMWYFPSWIAWEPPLLHISHRIRFLGISLGK